MFSVRRMLFMATLLVLIASVVILSNSTAPNPTGRRYASQSPLTTGQGTAQEIGNDGERILAQDLGAPNNNDADQRQCICNQTLSTVPGQCRVCVVSVNLGRSQHRLPDFFTRRWIAESKNVATLNDLAQITDYASGARALRVPLWVYVRVDTEVEPVYFEIVESTGGGIVRYFTVPGYIDAVDVVALVGLVGVTVSLVLLSISVLQDQGREPAQPAPSPPRRTPRRRQDTVTKAGQAIDDVEIFAGRSKDSARQKIDRQDARDELDK